MKKWFKILLCFGCFANTNFAQNVLFNKTIKPEYGLEVGALYDNSTHLNFGVNVFKCVANEWAFYVNKISTGLEIGLFDDKTLYHYIEYSSTAWIFQLGLRFNQYKITDYRVSMTPFLGLSIMGKYNLFTGYVFTNDYSQGNRIVIGFNSIFSFTKGFEKL